MNSSLLASSMPGVEPITMVTSRGTVKAEPFAIRGGVFTDKRYSQSRSRRSGAV